ncbi:MAG: PD-(D/E)XK nuclease family protein [bacterium]
MKKELSQQEVLNEIKEAFELNYEQLRLEGGHALTEDVKRLALQMVLLYWKKMPDVAENITDTEVKLSLPEQKTPQGRKFSIEGIVDIIREQDETWMYDIKTHDGDYVRDNIDLYEKQLNVYSYIWKGLRGEPLDHTAIIALSFPQSLSDAVRTGDQQQIDRELPKWKPLIEVPFDQGHVEETIKEFGKVVDRIEDNQFSPPPVRKLKERIGSELFVTRVCRNCDARFSCASFREYALGTNARFVSGYKKYIEDLGPEIDVEDRKTTNLETANIPESVDTSD